MPLPGSAIDVPCSLFSGLNTELSPSDLPEGVSPSNQDVAFLPGSVFTRPGAHRLFTTVAPLVGKTLPGVNYFKTFSPAGGAVVTDGGSGGIPSGAALGDQTVLLDSNGFWWQEFLTNPGVLTEQLQIVPAGTRAQSVTAFNREFFAFSDGVKGLCRPLFLNQNGQWRRVSQDGPAFTGSVADSAVAGSISSGAHQVVTMFLTDSGYLTPPSPPITWTAAGGKKVSLTNVPVGPSNVVARVFAFTGSGGDNFFSILQNVTFPSAVAATVLFDNTSTTVTLDFTDTALFGATAIDVAGNDQFALVPVSPCVGFFYYANRLFCWGELNRVTNLINMSLTGGVGTAGTIPMGWTTFTGGTLTHYGTIPTDLFWVITGGAGNQGMLLQNAYRDAFGIAILQGGQSYEFFCLACRNTSDNTGNLIADVFSPSQGQLAQAIIPLSRLPVVNLSTGAAPFQASFISQPLNNALPATLPSDVQFRVYLSGAASTQQVAFSEMSLAYASQPYRLVARGSYVDNPEAFDSVTGDIGPSSDNTPIRDMFVLRDNLYLLTAKKLHETRTDSTEPGSWDIREVADECGTFGPHSSTGGEDWRMWAGPTGMRIFEGQYPWKISQEIQTKWDAINLAYQQLVWVQNDPVNRRCYVGVPTGSNTSPNQIYVLDYRELDTAYDIGKSATIHISFTGKMIASDLARKWTIWNLASNHGAILNRSGNQRQFCIGGPFGNIHYFDSAKLTDDDYGQLPSEYYSYFFINHEAEMALGVGSHRKLYPYLTAFVSGTGQLTVTPYAASLTNPLPSLPPITLSATPGHDMEWPMNALAERVAFKFKVTPLQGQTDAYFNLQKMVVKLREDPWMPVRGAI